MFAREKLRPLSFRNFCFRLKSKFFKSKMLNLQKRINGEDDDRQYLQTRIAIRERLLAQELKDLEVNLKNQNQCRLSIPSTSQRHELELLVTPQEGIYRGGRFRFSISVPPEYNNVPPNVKCLTRVWHPNINEEGSICLSILRQNSLDAFGWRPTRNLTEVVHGLTSLFTDLIDFDDALNIQAAQQWSQNREAFSHRAREYIQRYC
ncbi:unnamed protein product [Caenorhabditis auriculariae]|uniref:E2 NEDD8-conjugating enzyme n=1 Tax=Caenorhabditis auriculariae TaxID=2777116 RepID=A0A8S1GRW0_9PELO|nr:unnamed protein product [Caenorhabditis auriculariae]